MMIKSEYGDGCPVRDVGHSSRVGEPAKLSFGWRALRSPRGWMDRGDALPYHPARGALGKRRRLHRIASTLRR